MKTILTWCGMIFFCKWLANILEFVKFCPFFLQVALNVKEGFPKSMLSKRITETGSKISILKP